MAGEPLTELVNAARVYINVVEERYAGRTGWASVSEARSLLLSAAELAEAAIPVSDGLHRIVMDAIETSWQESGYTGSARLSRAAHATASAVLAAIRGEPNGR